MKIYIVKGEIGEYSDRYEWIVSCFTTKEAAETCVLKEKAKEDPKHFYGKAYYDIEEMELRDE